MKLKLIASLVAASFLAGCSSSGSNDTSPQAGIENPIELPLWGDEGAKEVTFVEIKGQTNIIVDGESVGRVKDGTVYNSNGDIVGTVDIVQKDENGQPIAFVGKTANGADITWTKSGGLVINNPPQQENPIEIPVWGGDEAKHIELVELNGQTVLTVNNETVAYVVNGDVRNAQGDSIGSLTYHEKDANGNPSVVVIQGHDGNTYSWNKSTGLNISKTNVDSGWGHQPTPDNDLPEFGLDTRESRYHFEESVPNSLWSIVNSETGDVIGQAVITTDNNIKIRIGDKDHQFTNTKALQDENGNLTSIAFKTPSGKSGYWSKDDGFVMTNGNPVDGGWGHQPTPDQIDSIKDKAKSLSQEQRQQIKQAIKDRAPRS
uniref:Lipoprotein n=1 Tax=Aliivibrio wodanis TaxID=80852 RepID=A0A5Q4ZU44_9GAMM|nr:hypothetical protein AW0309160_02296 [Aliivibrio wodanis]